MRKCKGWLVYAAWHGNKSNRVTLRLYILMNKCPNGKAMQTVERGHGISHFSC
jgi:hypothetical protein